MIGFLRWLFGMPPLVPQVWLVRENGADVWHKVVVYERPRVVAYWHLLGPFRSEVDAEEAADRLNGEDVPLYRQPQEDRKE